MKDKTVKGLGWSSLDSFVMFFVNFLVSLVLARLLTPDDYGLIGLTAIFNTVCNTLINGGMQTALIRKKDATDDDYNTSFIVNMGMSFFLYLLIFLCSPLIAEFFKRTELVALCRYSSLIIIINALTLVQQTRLIKRIDFKTQTKITFISSMSCGIFAIILAFIGFGVWSLVILHLSRASMKSVLLWYYNKWMPKLKFSKQSFYELFGFGWKMMVSTLLSNLWKELYQVVVAKFYSPATLGQYSRAKHFAAYFSRDLTIVIQRVTYPVLSNMQDNKERMISGYRRIIKTTMFVTAIGIFFLGGISEPLIYCLIGPKWHEASTYLPIICISSSLYPLHAINLNMLKVQGRSDLFLGLEIVKKIIAVGPLMVGAFVGIIPMLLSSVAFNIICYFLNSYYTGKLLGYSSWVQIKDVAPSYTIAIIIAFSVYFLKYLPLSFWIILPMQIILGAALFFLICITTQNNEYKELKDIVFSYIKKKKR